MKLENKKVLLTGATGGIGRELARQLADHGARLHLIGRNREALNCLVKEIPGEHRIHMHDLITEEGRASLVAEFESMESSIDILINGAGVSEFALLGEMDESRVHELIHANLVSPMLLTQQLLPYLSKTDARILNIGSTLGSIGYPGYSVYCASKFGLRGFSEALSREVSDRNILVKYAAPRATNTSINTNSVTQLNNALGSDIDEPTIVAEQLLQFIRSERQSLHIGWPEKMFVKVNALFSSLVSRNIRRQLPTIKHFAQENQR